jgi:phosphate-selective porin OprO and OprP
VRTFVPARGATATLIGVVVVASLGATAVFAQAPNAEPFAPSVPETQVSPAPPVVPGPPGPALPDPAVPPAAVVSEPATREALLEDRIRQLESMVNQLSTQVQQLAPPGGGASSTAGGPAARGTAAPDVGVPATVIAPSATGGVGGPGQSLPPNPALSPRFNSPATLDKVKGNFVFGPGFELRTNDDEYILQFHDLTQFDYRGYTQGGQTQVHDGFAFPRQWWMWSGRVTKPIGYFISFANGFDTFAILDVFLDLDFNPKFRMRVGRMKTPFTYEFLVEPIQGLVTPERSMFFNNFGQNRDDGFMAFGRLFDNTVDYAGGIFNGTRNGTLSMQNTPATSWFGNWRPFGNEENTLLENFNIGGSVFASNFDQLPIPVEFRTVVPTTGNALLGTPFLNLNNNVRMYGPMAFWDLHLAYFYGGLAWITEWQSGYQSYAIGSGHQTKVPVGSFYSQVSYLITGETRSSIGIVKPNNPVTFGRGNGWHGCGAIEPFFRYEYLQIGSQIFTSGFADQNLWANRLFQTDLGVNWHLTQYVKMYFDWIHDEFNQPVLFAPGRRQLTVDEFLVRFQLYF